MSLEKKKELEDKIVVLLGQMSHAEKLILYAYLHRGEGISMDKIDEQITKALAQQES